MPLFPSFHSVTSLDISRGQSIYTTAIGKGYKPELLFFSLESRLLHASGPLLWVPCSLARPGGVNGGVVGGGSVAGQWPLRSLADGCCPYGCRTPGMSSAFWPSCRTWSVSPATSPASPAQVLGVGGPFTAAGTQPRATGSQVHAPASTAGGISPSLAVLTTVSVRKPQRGS